MACPEAPDIALTQSSGALVPKPITTMPTTNGEIPSRRASAAAPSTKASLDFASAKSPPAMNATESQSGMSA